MFKLVNTIQPYPWGSKKFIQELTGIKSDGPIAELWMGVHPRGESKVELDNGELSPLSSIIDESLATGERDSPTGLPFLFKLLAAGSPLSIQAHPNKKQAEKGFLTENSKLIPLTDNCRNYKDKNHKPEIICAITPFWVMKGFLSIEEIKNNFTPWLPPSARKRFFPVKSPKFAHQAVQDFFHALMKTESQEKTDILNAAIKQCIKKNDSIKKWVLKLHEIYPGDIGILSPFYLNTLRLEPGEALFLPAGELHAYLEGFGVELMANSDNVLRGGLTSKHIDIPELMKTLSFETSKPCILNPKPLSDCMGFYESESKEFQLVKFDLDYKKHEIYLGKHYQKSILIVLQGCISIYERSQVLKLRKGESCYFSNDCPRRILNTSESSSGFIARVCP